MKLYKKIFIILVVFFKTETLFSQNNLFNVNNIELEKKDKITNDVITDQAIKKGFNQLKTKILLKEDRDKLSDLKFSSIKQLVKYYKISSITHKNKNKKLLNFSITFDEDKIHNLFFKRGISYSEISDKELYILPIFIKDNDVLIFNNNFFYENWNEVYQKDLIEFILPLENIETIQKINNFKNNLINLNPLNLLNEYSDKNLALILIEDNKTNNIKIYIKLIIQGKNISKNLNLDKSKIMIKDFKDKIIYEIKEELINLIKSENLIDIGTPFFLNAKLNLDKKNDLVKLNSKIKKILLIENVYVQKFNKDYVNLKIKYLGKLDKIISELRKENIELQLINDQWVIKTL